MANSSGSAVNWVSVLTHAAACAAGAAVAIGASSLWGSASKAPTKSSAASSAPNKTDGERQRVFTAAQWERKVGYCRAIRAGNHIYVTGTVALDEHGACVCEGDGKAQATRALQIIDQTLKKLGATKTDIVRTRMFVTDIARWREFGEAHRAFFDGDIVPATSMIQISALIDPKNLIEIEADAVVTAHA